MVGVSLRHEQGFGSQSGLAGDGCDERTHGFENFEQKLEQKLENFVTGVEPGLSQFAVFLGRKDARLSAA